MRAAILLGAVLIGVLVWPAPAFAAGGGGLDPEVLEILAVIAVAYLVTHLLLERLAERFGFVTGVEYIILGIILGPVLGWVDADTTDALTPVIVLGVGSLGLLIGLGIDRRKMDSFNRRAVVVSAIISVCTYAVMLAVPSAAFYYFGSAELLESSLPLLMVVAAVAMVADNGPIRALANLLDADGEAVDFAVAVARGCAAFGIIGFGLIFCFFNDTALPEGLEVASGYTWLVWLAIELALGGVLGLVFSSFLRRDFADEKIITIIIGMVIFTSGAAFYLDLSPLFVNFIMGIVLINTAPHADHVHARLKAIHRPLYIVLFFFGGIMWSLEAPLWGIALVVAYIPLRRLGRLVGSVAASRAVDRNGSAPGSGLSRPLLAPGALSVAMLLKFSQVYADYPGLEHVDMLYNGLLTAIVVTEIFSYPLTRSWLIDEADVAPPETRQETEESTAAGEVS
ncbi:MAG: hypothetical protein ACOCV2_02195 [Persicimonas sp.]